MKNTVNCRANDTHLQTALNFTFEPAVYAYGYRSTPNLERWMVTCVYGVCDDRGGTEIGVGLSECSGVLE